MKVVRILDIAYNPLRWVDPVLKWRLGPPGPLTVDITQPWTHGFAMEIYAAYAGISEGWDTEVVLLQRYGYNPLNSFGQNDAMWRAAVAEAVSDGVDMLCTSMPNLQIYDPCIWNALEQAGIPCMFAHGANRRVLFDQQDAIGWPSYVTYIYPTVPNVDLITNPVTSFGPAAEFASYNYNASPDPNTPTRWQSIVPSQSFATASMVANMTRALDVTGGNSYHARAILRATGGAVKNDISGFGLVPPNAVLATGIPVPAPETIVANIPCRTGPPPGPPPPPPPPQPQPPTPFLSTYPNLVYT